MIFKIDTQRMSATPVADIPPNLSPEQENEYAAALMLANSVAGISYISCSRIEIAIQMAVWINNGYMAPPRIPLQ